MIKLFLFGVLASIANATQNTPIVNSTQQNPQSSQHDLIQYIGPMNINGRYIRVKNYQDSTKKSAVDAVGSYYNFRPMLRDLHVADMGGKDIFDVLVKREISWTFPDLNEFGLMRCEEDLLFRYPHKATFIELESKGRRAFIQHFENLQEYNQAVDSAKQLQLNCLIKGLEKSSGSPSPIDCQTRIPLCFSDNWHQIWWKEEGDHQHQSNQQHNF